MRFGSLALILILLGTLSVAAAVAEPVANRSDTPKNHESCAAHQVLVVLVYDESCKHACAVVRPVMHQLVKEFDSKIRYVELNASPAHLKETKKAAKALGIGCFLADGTDEVPLVGIFEPGKGQPREDLPGVRKPEVYRTAIVKVLGSKQ